MTTELDPRLKLCWELAERDRDKTPSQFRRDLDGIFWHLLNLCDTANLNIHEVKADLTHIAGLPERFEWSQNIKPRTPPKILDPLIKG